MEIIKIPKKEGIIDRTTDYRRTSFMKMIQDALSGKIDLIFL